MYIFFFTLRDTMEQQHFFLKKKKKLYNNNFFKIFLIFCKNVYHFLVFQNFSKLIFISGPQNTFFKLILSIFIFFKTQNTYQISTLEVFAFGRTSKLNALLSSALIFLTIRWTSQLQFVVDGITMS